MHRFWDSIVRPLIWTFRPGNIVEIGADLGDNTKNLLEYCQKNNAVLHCIDPLPKFDVDQYKNRYGDCFLFYNGLSLNALPQIETFDMVLIDGDHNWYTVFHELKLIAKRCRKSQAVFPLILAHDVGWPYGRRDLYYNPENIPDIFRKPHCRKGIHPDSPELVEQEGLNSHLNNAIYENDYQSGVLTALEDFMDDEQGGYRLFTLPGLHGLGILCAVPLLENNPDLKGFISAIEIHGHARDYVEALERERIKGEIALVAVGAEKRNLQEEIKKSNALVGSIKSENEALRNDYKKIRSRNDRLTTDIHRIEMIKKQLERALQQAKKENIDLKQKQAAAVKQADAILKNYRAVSSALINSNSWKFGKAIAEFSRIVRLRPKVPMAVDAIRELDAEYHNFVAEHLDENTRFRIAIKVPVPKKERVETWGDFHFARSLEKALKKRGHGVRIDLLDAWYEDPLEIDVVIVLRGLSPYQPASNHINIMWNISHPDKVGIDEYGNYDHICLASEHYVSVLSGKTDTPVSPLLQCTDTHVFFQDASEDVPVHDLLFVGNSRKKYRKIVKDSIEQGLPLTVYGTRWEGIIDKRYIQGQYIDNQELHKYYSNCKVLLNDHWPSMGRYGFFSNRLFDAGACGACVVSDEALGMEAVFGDAITTYKTPEDLKRIVQQLIADEKLRTDKGRQLKEIVIENNTFDNRAEQLENVIRQIHRKKRQANR